MKRMGLRIMVFILLTGPCLAGFHEDYLQIRRQLIRKQLRATGAADIQALKEEQKKLYRELLQKYDPTMLTGKDRRIGIRMLLDLEEYERAWNLLSGEIEHADGDQWILATAAVARFGMGDLKGADAWLDRMNHAAIEYSQVCMRIGRRLVAEGREDAAVSYLNRAVMVPTLDPRIRKRVVRELFRIYENQQKVDEALQLIGRLRKSSFVTTDEKKALMDEANRLLMIGKPAPELMNVVYWLNSDRFQLSDMKGSVVVLDFFAPWCGPCVKSFPGLKRMKNELKEKGLRLVGITRLYGSYRDDRTVEKDTSPARELELIRNFVERHELDWPIAVTRDATGTFESYLVRGIPRLVVIDREGRVRAAFGGVDPSGKVRRFIERLLEE